MVVQLCEFKKTKQNTELDKKYVQERTLRKHLSKMALGGDHEKKS